ncbi:hypothetical protein M5D96_014231 [Drosophila gunungcola]|uniref:RNA helicase n=1 Tax=Drosophila gunungcola TaxID=103775 RepID=A0A9Q0BHI9_9MUSC|nr:hypothetical protein M5D96_014231 [Drosophila gunungcola]
MAKMEGCAPPKDMDDPNDAVGDSYCAKDAIRPLVASNCSEHVVAHSTRPMQPARRFSDVAYTWPHLDAGLGHGALIVGAPRSGRTFAYVPAVCQAVCKSLTESRQWRIRHPGQWQPDALGALALILVPDLQRVRQVSAVCHALLRKTSTEDWVTLTLNVPSGAKSEFFLRLLNVVGCLVATPAQLTSFLLEARGLLRFPRLQFLVYDDVDQMPGEQLRNAQQALQEILPTTHYPQVVMVSQSYSDTLMAKLKAVSDQPAVIFGDILEAALYGGTRIRISLVRSQTKSIEVAQLLQLRPPQDYRTVIYCKDDGDLRGLAVALEDHGFRCLPYCQNSVLEDREKVHNWQEKSGGLILLCTDDCPELTIRNAHTLIHHGMSTACYSMIATKGSFPTSWISYNYTRNVDPALAALVQRIRKDAVVTRGKKHALCGQILMLGECRDPVCERRHHVDADVDRRASYVPASGDVKVQLVRVYSPTHFCVRLLEHRPPEGSWQTLPHLAVQEMRLKLPQTKEPLRYWPPVAGAICMLHTYVHVQRASPGAQGHAAVATDGFDLRLLGMVPQSGESSWTEEERRQIEFLLTQLPKDHFLQANVQFATANTLFVQDLLAMVYADNFKVHLRRLNLCQKLVNTQLARRCEHAKKKILDFFEEMFNKEVKVEQEVEEKIRKTQRFNCNEEGMSQLYECLMNCAMLQVQDKKHAVKDTDPVVEDPAEFLNKVMNGGSKQCDSPAVDQKQKKKNKAKSAHTAIYLDEIPLQAHPNVVRPQGTYYQTISTLELQVCLPEDDHEYRAELLDNQIFFRATSTSSALIHQFILSLKFPYSKMRHHMTGRTVYISVIKSLAYIDPLDFGEYRFLKHNHEMFSKIDDYLGKKLVEIKRFLEDRVYVKQIAKLEESSDNSDDEERDLNGIERVDHYQISDCM